MSFEGAILEIEKLKEANSKQLRPSCVGSDIQFASEQKAFDMAIKALTYCIAKQPVEHIPHITGFNQQMFAPYYACPTCRMTVKSGKELLPSYCPECGQSLKK
jgi:hypothetical protein